jgi:hypothetical protein
MIGALVFILFALVGGVAGAQDIPTFCGDLSDDDCALLTESAQAMQELDSAVFHLDFDFGMNGVPGMDSVNFQITGDGAVALDRETLGVLLQSPEAIMANIEDLPQMVEQGLEAISADVTFVLHIPAEIAAQSGTEMPEQVSISLRLVDGYGYINLDKLAELDTGGSLPRGWQGIDLAGLYGALLEQQMDTFGEMFSAMGNMDTMSAFTDPEFIANFTTIERGEDTEIDGQAAAVFEMAIDYDAMFSDPAMQAYLRSAFEGMSGFTGEEPDKEMTDMILSMYSQMFDGLVLEITQAIGLDDHYVHRTTVHMDWTPDFGAMMGTTTSTTMPEMNFVFDAQVDVTRFNDAPEITAPEDATIYPIEGVIPGLRNS